MAKFFQIAKWLLILFALAVAYWWLSQEKPIEVTIVYPQKGLVEATVANTRTGSVTACQRAKMSLPIGGQIANILVKEGQLVAHQQLLLSLWNKDRLAKLKEATALLHASQQDKNRVCIVAANAQTDLIRQSSLLKQRLTSQEKLDSAQSTAQATQANCEAAQFQVRARIAQVEGIEANIELTYLKAPFSGIIAEITGEVGEYTTPSPPGVPIPPTIDMLTQDCHYISAPIDEVDASELKVGLPVRITIDAFRSQSFEGVLRRISPYVQDFEKQARTITIEVDLKRHRDPHLLAGYSADVEVILGSKEGVLRLPSDLIINDQYVLILNNEDVIERVPVQLGLSNWQFSEITAGLSAQHRVISSLGLAGVKPGVSAIAK